MEDIKRRLFDESQKRIHTCLENISEADLWFRPNDQSNSIGNLILHLNGNIRQWILTGLGGNPDIRVRQQEFDEKGPVELDVLRNKLDATLLEVRELLEKLPAEILTKKIVVQGFQETGISILIHVVEHFSYHTGQITYITKMLKNKNLKYYGDINLDSMVNG